MKIKLLLCFYMAFAFAKVPAQNNDSLTPGQLAAIDSTVHEQLKTYLELVSKTTATGSIYGDYRARGLNPDADILADWKTEAKKVSVVDIQNTTPALNPAERKEAGLQSYVLVRLSKPAPWLRDPRWRSELCLTINGMPLPEVRPLFFNNDSVFTFYLERGDSSVNQITWDILQQIVNWQFTRKVKLSIGTPVLPALEVANTKETAFTYIIVYKTGALIFLGIAVLMGFLFYYFRKSPMFRDAPGDNSTLKPDETSYSLAKVQLAFWTVIIILCETYIWCITGVLPDLSASSLVLLGMSVGTTALSTFVGYANELKGRKASGNFWKDLISDAAGIPSLHRVQMLIWTLLIGFYFVRQSWLHFSMPDISENMLILMGISSGTYVALKTQERKKLNNTDTQDADNTDNTNDEPAAG